MSADEKKPGGKTPKTASGTDAGTGAGTDADVDAAKRFRDTVPSGSAHRKFVRNLFKRGEEFIEELVRDNETHMLRIMQLENEIRDLREEVPPDVTADELRRLIDHLKKEHAELQKRYDEVKTETERYKKRYQFIEEENDKLANLFVASYQLHSTLDFADVVQILLEILLNFVGAGRFALMVKDEDDERFHPLAAYGVKLEDLSTLPDNGSVVTDCLKDGRPYVADGPLSAAPFDPANPTVAIPLKLSTQIIGVITIYSFLQQKTEIVPIDMELFKLLSDHAGAVLESARLFCTTEEQSRTIGAYRSLLPGETEP